MSQSTTIVEPLNPSLKKWSVEDYHRMIEFGILTSDDQVEFRKAKLYAKANVSEYWVLEVN